MKKMFGYGVFASLACVLPFAACTGGDTNAGGGGTTTGSSSGGTTSSTETGGGGSTTTSTGDFVRVHYRLQGTGDVATWGVHYWGAGSTSPNWGTPQLFDKSDAFGGFTDVLVTAIGDTDDAWLGLIPVHCTSTTDCTKDIETEVRWVDLEKNAANGHVAECWITQGQAVQTKTPTATGPVNKVNRPNDFIDLGDGSVRLMFRVPTGSTGTVKYGVAQNNLDKSVTWAATDDINTNGLTVTGLATGTKIYYEITSNLDAGGSTLTDTSAVVSLTPLAFSPITQAADWATWASSSVMYEVMVRSFADGGTPKTPTDPAQDSGIDPNTMDGIGDLVGLLNILPYLKDLGIDTLWMTPGFKAKSYHGYDTTDFYEIDPALGSRKDFVNLTTASHALGIKIVLDLVQNHVADVNPWFQAALDPADPNHAKYHDWFVWSDEYTNMMADKHPWDASAVVWACAKYTCYNQIFGGAMPELNFHNVAVRDEMKKIAQYWLDMGADGFRLDASKHIDQFDEDHMITPNKAGTHVWWKEFNHFVKKQVTHTPTVFLAGENRWDKLNLADLMVPFGGDMDSQFDFPFRTVLDGFVGGATDASGDFVGYLKDIQTKAKVTANGGNPNHFFERFLSNQDLDRPATTYDAALLPQLAAIVLTVPGMPVIYYGEELGKQGKRDKYLGTESWEHDEFIREPMSWYQTVSFTGDKTTSWDIDFAKTNTDNTAVGLGIGMCKAPNLDYPFIKYMTENDSASYAAQAGQITPTPSLYELYKILIAIRKAHPATTALDTTINVTQNTADVYEYTLTKGPDTLTVVLNRKATTATITRPTSVTDLITKVKGTSFSVPAHGVLILT